MVHNNDSGNSDFLANARASLQSSPKPRKSTNPFREGLERGMANWRKSQAQWATGVFVPKVAACPTCTKQISTNTANCLHCGEPLSKKLWREIMAKQEARETRRTLYGLGAIAVVLAGVHFWPHHVQQSQVASASSLRNGVSALEKMATAFKGGYTREQIELEAAAVLRLFDQPLSDANYEYLGNMLVTLRKGVEPNTEMDILVCMKSTMRQAYGTKLQMAEIAAICVAGISAGL